MLISVAATAADGAANPIAIAQFVQRTREYVSLRERAVARQPPLEETGAPAEIDAREKTLAAAIRAARAGARRGEIFGSAQAPLAAAARREWRQRTPSERTPPASIAPPPVNAPYPEEQPLETFSPKLLEVFPELPTEIEYRFFGPHLILRDVEANLIVDVIPDVLREAPAR